MVSVHLNLSQHSPRSPDWNQAVRSRLQMPFLVPVTVQHIGMRALPELMLGILTVSSTVPDLGLPPFNSDDIFDKLGAFFEPQGVPITDTTTTSWAGFTSSNNLNIRYPTNQAVSAFDNSFDIPNTLAAFNTATAGIPENVSLAFASGSGHGIS